MTYPKTDYFDAQTTEWKIEYLLAVIANERARNERILGYWRKASDRVKKLEARREELFNP